ncbi:unnamed protein product [Urochloa humidicola]
MRNDEFTPAALSSPPRPFLLTPEHIHRRRSSSSPAASTAGGDPSSQAAPPRAHPRRPLLPTRNPDGRPSVGVLLCISGGAPTLRPTPAAWERRWRFQGTRARFFRRRRLVFLGFQHVKEIDVIGIIYTN